LSEKKLFIRKGVMKYMEEFLNRLKLYLDKHFFEILVIILCVFLIFDNIYLNAKIKKLDYGIEALNSETKKLYDEIESLKRTVFPRKSNKDDIIYENSSKNSEPFSQDEIERRRLQAEREKEYIKPEDPIVRSTSNMLFREENREQLEQSKWLDNAETIYNWILTNFRYVPDTYGIEKYPKETIIDGDGDCEDFVYLYLSLAIASGVPTENIRGVFAEMTDNEEKTTWYHYYIEIKYEIDSKYIWMPVEVTPYLMKMRLDFRYFKTEEFWGLKRRIYWFNTEEIGVFVDG